MRPWTVNAKRGPQEMVGVTLDSLTNSQQTDPLAPAAERACMTPRIALRPEVVAGLPGTEFVLRK